MGLSDITDVAVSGLEAQRARMTVTASNLANAESTRSAGGGAYRRRDPVFSAQPIHRPFGTALERRLRTVEVTRVVEDTRPLPLRYDPAHPDADGEGYVTMPRVNVVEEMADMMSASRSFEANLVMMRKAREMGEAALRMGR